MKTIENRATGIQVQCHAATSYLSVQPGVFLNFKNRTKIILTLIWKTGKSLNYIHCFDNVPGINFRTENYKNFYVYEECLDWV